MGASARAPTAGGRRWRKTGALALVVCVLAITVVQRRQPTMLWRRCPAGLDYRSRRCVRLCDDLASCMPDFDSLLVTWPDGPPGLAAAARTLVPYTIRIEVLDRTGASLYPSSAGLCPDPSFSLLLEGSGERMLVEEPRRLDWGVYELPFQLLVAGRSKLTVYLGGRVLWDVEHLDSYDEELFAPPVLEALRTYVVDVVETSSLPGYVASLPWCAEADFADMRGRWISSSAALPDMIPATTAQGKDELFLPDRCKLRAMPASEARRCLAGGLAVFSGDSTMVEAAVDFAMYLDETVTDTTPDYSMYQGQSKTCKEPRYQSHGFLWPVAAAQIRIAFAWNASPHQCTGHFGIREFRTNPGVRQRLFLAVSDPAKLADLPVIGVEMPDLQTPSPTHQTDVLIFNTGLHDMTAMRANRSSVADFEDALSQTLTALRPYAKTAYFRTTVTKGRRANPLVHALNRKAIDIALRSGYKILRVDQISSARFDAGLNYMLPPSADQHHMTNLFLAGQERNRFIHAPTLALLHDLCFAKS